VSELVSSIQGERMKTEQRTTRGTALLIPCSYLTTEGNKTGSWRFLRPKYDYKNAPCSVACPAAEDISRVQMLTAQGLFKEAWETILQENPLPGICGRVCYHPCESVCNRHEFDEAVAIHVIERFLSDTAIRYDLKPSLERMPAKSPKIAVIGAGPSGLAAAYFLTRLGYSAEVFEAASEPGGVLRWGIPPYRLPLAVLKHHLALLQEFGVRIHCNRAVDRSFLQRAHEHFDAIYLGCGHSGAVDLGIPGTGLNGVQDGLEFLRQVRLGKANPLQGAVAVIGGGNTAIDVARAAARLGGKPLVIYRRRRQDMPAFTDEIEAALEEGVELLELHTPVKIERHGDFLEVVLQKMKVSGEDRQGRAFVVPDGNRGREIQVHHLFKAIGAAASEDWYEPPKKGRGHLRLSNCVFSHRLKGIPLVYGGDLVADIKSVVHAVASGKQAAMALDAYFSEGPQAIKPRLQAAVVGHGPSLSMEVYLGGPRSQRNQLTVGFQDLNTDYFLFAERISQPRLLPHERLQSFAEIDLKIAANVAIREAERCFNCGLCNHCDNCRLFCPDLAVNFDSSSQTRAINYDYCKGCGLCVVECPRNAMSLEEESA